MINGDGSWCLVMLEMMVEMMVNSGEVMGKW